MFVGIKKLSSLTGLSERRIYALTHEGIIPCVKSKGKFYYNPEKVIEALNASAAENLNPGAEENGSI